MLSVLPSSVMPRVAGVVVIDCDPVESCPEIGLHLLHQIARGGAKSESATPSSAETMKRN
jgi:hypothetical protein